MASVQVRTSQNVLIDYNIAGIGDRILAALLDYAIIVALYFAIFYFFSSKIDDNGIAVIIILILPLFLYHILSEIFMNGQTIGKRQLKIRVVKLDGSRPSIGAYLIRWILRPVDMGISNGAVAVLCIALSKNGQRLGDMLAGTTVIKLTSSKLDSNPVVEEFQDEYEPVFQEVYRLTDQEVDLIDRALAFNRLEGNPEAANLLAEKLAEKMGVVTDMPAIKFLHTVKKDYNHITSQ